MVFYDEGDSYIGGGFFEFASEVLKVCEPRINISDKLGAFAGIFRFRYYSRYERFVIGPAGGLISYAIALIRRRIAAISGSHSGIVLPARDSISGRVRNACFNHAFAVLLFDFSGAELIICVR